jgi:hypothetical protein
MAAGEIEQGYIDLTGTITRRLYRRNFLGIRRI